MRKSCRFPDTWQLLCPHPHPLLNSESYKNNGKTAYRWGSVASKLAILIIIKDQPVRKVIKFLFAPSSRLISSRVIQTSIHLTPITLGAFCGTSHPILIQAKNWFSISNVKCLLSSMLLSCPYLFV